MNTRPSAEIADQAPDSRLFRPDFPKKDRLGKLLETYADNLLEPRSEKVILLSEVAYFRN